MPEKHYAGSLRRIQTATRRHIPENVTAINVALPTLSPLHAAACYEKNELCREEHKQRNYSPIRVRDRMQITSGCQLQHGWAPKTIGNDLDEASVRGESWSDRR